ncbi:integrase domain-containing protein [Shewanella gaetbuli]
MARLTNPLTATEIAKAKPREKEYNLADGRGLQLRVKPNGSKHWLFNYSRPVTKKRANLSLGSYPDLSLADARKKREEARELLANEIDPQAQLQQDLEAKQAAISNTLQLIVDDWFEVKRQQVTPDHAAKLYRRFELYILPYLGKTPIGEITAPMAIQILKPLEAQGKLETCKRVISWFNEVMTFAVNTGIIHSNPLAGISAAFRAPEKKHMLTIPPNELPELMTKLANGEITETTCRVIQFQLHTMTRPSEAASARWDEIDFENGLWIIPAEKMKMKRPHIVPLTPQVVQLLEAQQEIAGHRPYIFPSLRRPLDHTHTQTANMALSRIGFKDRLVSHGLRSLASTTLNEHGFDSELIEVSLAHVDKNTVRSAYNRADYIERRRELLCWWSRHIVEVSPNGDLI